MLDIIKGKDTKDREFYSEALFDMVHARHEKAKSQMREDLGVTQFPTEKELESLREGVTGDDLKSLNKMIAMMMRLKPVDKSELKKHWERNNKLGFE